MRYVRAYRVADTMTQVHAGVAETDTRERSSERHLAHGLKVAQVFGDPRQTLYSRPQRPHGEDIRNRIAALVRRAELGVAWSGYTFSVAAWRHSD